MIFTPKGWGSRLRTERKRLGRTQADVAKLVGISIPTYLHYEREEHEPKITFINKLNGLGFDVRSIFFSMEYKANAIPPRLLQLEMRAFALAQEYVNKTYADELGDEGRFALFNLFRTRLEILVSHGAEMPCNLEAFNKSILALELNFSSLDFPKI